MDQQQANTAGARVHQRTVAGFDAADRFRQELRGQRLQAGGHGMDLVQPVRHQHQFHRRHGDILRVGARLA
ncbi:MAG: hypothetical protein WDM96_14855 [Lacunisphaera sp.]